MGNWSSLGRCHLNGSPKSPKSPKAPRRSRPGWAKIKGRGKFMTATSPERAAVLCVTPCPILPRLAWFNSCR